MTSSFIFLLLLITARAEEVATPSSLLGPRNFNHHSYVTQQYLEEPEPTKQGPVLFPNDGPPQPRRPLIVTSRPLLESIARSDLNPYPNTNNSIAEPSQINRVSFKPNFLGRIKNYKPFVYQDPLNSGAYKNYGDQNRLSDPLTSEGYQNYGVDHVPYADVLKKRLGALGRDNRYSDYEEKTILPPVYKVLADHAKEKVLRLPKKYVYQPQDNKGDSNNDANIDSDYNYGQNYAFSYRVNDRKTGDDFSHSQHSSGSATNGEYRVRLPDGRMQIVSYTADENGYKADVRYDEDNAIDNNNYVSNKDVGHSYVGNNVVGHKEVGHNDVSHNDVGHNDVSHNNVGHNDKHKAYDVNEHRNDDYDRQIDYNVKDDYYQYPESKEYYNDYSEVEKHDPYVSKFNNFKTSDQNTGVSSLINNNYEAKSTVTPSYNELKELFITKNPNLINAHNYLNRNIPVEINVPSTTQNPIYDGTTEHVVLIGGKSNLYTDIRHNVQSVTQFPVTGVTVTPVPVTYTAPSYAVTPRNYLASTIASLKNNVDFSGPKPVLSDSYINRINKYLSFN